MIRTTLTLAVLVTWPATLGFAQSADPVTVVFEAADERLSLEVGMVEEVRVMADSGAGPRLRVQLTDNASKLLAQFTSRYVGQRMNVYACREQVLSATVNARVSSGLIVIPAKDAESAQNMADMIWYGTGCDLFLKQ